MNHPTRRSFLEHTLAVAAAGFAAHRASAADDPPHAAPPAPPRRGSPNGRIGMAVIGLHGRGLTHVDEWTYDDDLDIVALCDVDPSTFGKAQDTLRNRSRPASRQYQDIRKLLEDKDVHAVSIATPNHWHSLAALWAMQAGKDVYVEKPVSHNVSEGRRLEQARVKYNRVCQAGTQSRSLKSVQSAIQFIHSGGIGKVLLARGLCYKRRETIGRFPDSAAPGEVAYDLWLGPAPVRPFNKNRFHYNWHWNWDYGNGDLGNQGVHQMDIARWALNAKLPASAFSLGGRFGYDDDGQTPNTQLTVSDYGDTSILFEVRGLPTPGLVGVTVGNIIYGTEGFVAFNSEDDSAVLAFDNAGKKTHAFKGSGSHFANFLTALRSRSQSDLNCPILEGHFSSALCHLGNISYRLGEEQSFGPRLPGADRSMDLAEAFGRFEQHLADSIDDLKKPLRLQSIAYHIGPKLEFDPQTEMFGKNEKANALLTRDYRAPFAVPVTL